MSLGLLGTKLGMTRIYDETGVSHPCTVVHVGGNVVTQVKDAAKDGYPAVQVAYGDQKDHRMAKPQLGHCKKAGAAPKRFMREFRGAGPKSRRARPSSPPRFPSDSLSMSSASARARASRASFAAMATRASRRRTAR